MKTIKKTIAVFSLVLMCMVCTQAHAAKKKNKQPNVLFIAVDDLRTQLACYGNGVAITPHIDQLASEGLLFEKAYCQQAICAASRISLLTSLRPENTGIVTLKQPLKKEMPNAVTLPLTFKNNGYETVSVGKIYHHATDDPKGWTKRYKMTGTKRYAEPTEYVEHKNTQHGYAYEAGNVEDNFYNDGQYAEVAIEELKKERDQPLFLAVGFNKPHLPFICPKKYWDLYDHDAFVVPEQVKPAGAPDCAFTTWGEIRSYAGMPKKGNMSQEESKNLIHAYHACVSYVDAQVGKMMAELEAQGMLENTIVILWGDHGWKLGEYGAWCKHTNFELDTHVPLIIKAPGHKAGVKSKALVEFVDIFPTLTELCGIETPSKLEGYSFVPLLDEPTREWKDAAFSIYPRGPLMGYSMRTENWRYTEWKDKKSGKVSHRELYDHSKTDLAIENVVDKAKNAELVKRLSAQLDAGWEGALPQ